MTACSKCALQVPQEVLFVARAVHSESLRALERIQRPEAQGWAVELDTDDSGEPRAVFVCPACADTSAPLTLKLADLAPTAELNRVRRELAESSRLLNEALRRELNLSTELGTLRRQLADANERANAYQARAANARGFIAGLTRDADAKEGRCEELPGGAVEMVLRVLDGKVRVDEWGREFPLPS